MVASSDADLAGRRDQESDAAKHAVTQEASFPAPSAGVVHRNTTGPAPVLVQLDGTGGVSSSEEESEENDESSDVSVVVCVCLCVCVLVCVWQLYWQWLSIASLKFKLKSLTSLSHIRMLMYAMYILHRCSVHV